MTDQRTPPAGTTRRDRDGRLSRRRLLAGTVRQPAPRGPARAQTTAAGTDVAAVAAAHGLVPEQIGFLVFDTADGRVLAAHNADRSFLPASVAKLPTAVTALEVLGADHRFATEVSATGAIAGGTLSGDLVLAGAGDPFLDTEDLEGLAAQVAGRGITRIDGRLLYDAGALAVLAEISSSQPIPAHYNPGVSALSANFNRVHARWQPGGGGVTAEAIAVSDGRELPVDWIAIDPAPTGSDRRAGFLFQPVGDRDGWLVSQSLSQPGALWLPVRNTPWHTASLFARLLAERGVAVPPPEPGRRPAGATPLGRHQSEPLVEIARLALHYSNNLTAELIGLAAARALGQPAGTLAQSAAAMTDWLSRTIAAADWSGFQPLNHSGLATSARVSPRQLAALLAYAWPRRYGGRSLFELLRQARFQDELNEGRDGPPVAVRAKTGTLFYGRGLAGYLQAASGRVAGFAVFVSDLPARAAADAEADRRFLDSPPGAEAWLTRARDAEKALVGGWALSL